MISALENFTVNYVQHTCDVESALGPRAFSSPFLSGCVSWRKYLLKMHLSAVQSRISVTLMVLLCLTGHSYSQEEEEHEAATKDTGIADIDLSGWQQSYNENQKLLLLLYSLDNCDNCSAALNSLLALKQEPALLPSGLKIVKSFNPELISKIGTVTFPTLVYLREKSYVIYDGSSFQVPDITDWLQLASPKIMERLDDQTFDTATKDGRGAINGDWLLVFYKQPCKNVLPLVESLGVRNRGRINFGKVNAAENPRLSQRFDISQCPTVIILKDQKMYKYPLDSVDTDSLRDFIDASYANQPEQAIPEPIQESGFEASVDLSKILSVLDFLSLQQLQDNSVLLVAAGAVLVLVLVLVVCCRGGSRKDKRKKPKKE